MDHSLPVSASEYRRPFIETMIPGQNCTFKFVVMTDAARVGLRRYNICTCKSGIS